MGSFRSGSGPVPRYIRARIEHNDLDKVVHFGRIWRLVYDGASAAAARSIATRPFRRLNNETVVQLVAHLTHPMAGGVTRHSNCRTQAGQVRRAGTAGAGENPPNLLGRFHAPDAQGLSPGCNAGSAVDGGPEPRMRIQAIQPVKPFTRAAIDRLQPITAR
jgi:hypothetical protein